MYRSLYPVILGLLGMLRHHGQEMDASVAVFPWARTTPCKSAHPVFG